MKISFETLPLIVVGVYFGPILGAFNAILADYLGWFLFYSHYPFFWMFTLQTALIGFLSGLFPLNNSFFFNLSIKTQLLIKRMFIYLFVLLGFFYSGICLFFIFHELDNSYILNLLLIFLSFVFWICIEVFLSYLDKKNELYYSVTLYSSMIVFIVTFITTFLLGPIIIQKYFEFFSIYLTSSFGEKNVYFFFLTTRMVKESIKAPILIFCLSNVLFSLNNFLKNKSGYESFVINDKK